MSAQIRTYRQMVGVYVGHEHVGTPQEFSSQESKFFHKSNEHEVNNNIIGFAILVKVINIFSSPY